MKRVPEEVRKGLRTMKNAYQRRRVKARVENRARMMRLDAITLDFARQVIEEETGAPLDIPAASAGAAPSLVEALEAGGPTASPLGNEARPVAPADKKK